MENLTENGQPTKNCLKNNCCDTLVKYLDKMTNTSAKPPMLLQGKESGVQQTSKTFGDRPDFS